MLKSAYVKTIRGTRAALDRTGMLARLQQSERLTSRHVASLFAIYDLDSMVSLDLPWWTYNATAEVDAFLLGRRSARVFEFGAGASTIWLASRAAEVHSVEHDTEFATQLAGHLERIPNVTLHPVAAAVRTPATVATSQRSGYENSDFDDYVGTIDNVGGLFDLIVIDGRAREVCLQRSIGHLADDGIIVFDNSDRKRYRTAIEDTGLHERAVRGWCPSLPTPSTTSLLAVSGP